MRKNLHAPPRAFIFSLFLLFTTLITNAQSGVVEGVLKDAQNQPLSFATITVFRAADTAVVNYKLSDPGGKFRITQLPLNVELRVLVSFTGYEPYRKNFMLTREASSLNLETIQLEVSDDLMEDVFVTAERPPVVMRKDTIEFNAASFKTLPTAMVEDLLKKLPGVELTEDGQFYVNGRKVNRILVDGREFFGNDVKTTSRNLPAYTIDKVQVHNDERDLLDDPNRPENEVGQVINLKLKKEYKKGMFGKLYAGGGTEDRYEAGGMVNVFRDTTQLSLIGYANNLSKSAFSMADMMNAGGFSRSGMSSIMVNSSGGFALNGASFGGLGSGIETVSGGGFNLNHNINKKIDLSAQYFYAGSKDIYNTTTVREQYINDTILITSSLLNRLTRTNSHSVSLRASWKIDSTSFLEFAPRANFSDGRITRPESSLTNQNFLGKLNESALDGKNIQNTFTYSHYGFYNKKFKKNYTFNWSNSININDNYTELIDQLVNTYFPDDTLYQNRKRENDIVSKNMSNTLSLNKVISKKLNYNIRLTSDINEGRSGITTYDALFEEDLYNIHVPELSNDYTRTDFRNELNARLGYNLKKFTFMPSVALALYNMDNNFRSLGHRQKNQFEYVLPSLNIRYGNYGNISFGRNVTLPGIDRMQPVANANNPMNIIIGDPNLQPVMSTSLYLNMYNYTNPKFSYTAYISGRWEDNAIVSDRTIDEVGNQVTRWVQTSGNKNFYANGNVNKTFTMSTQNKFTIGTGVGYNLTENVSFLNGQKIQSNVSSMQFSPKATMIVGNVLDFSLIYTHAFNENRFKNQVLNDFSYSTKNITNDVIVRAGKHFVFNSKYTMSYRQLTGPDMPRYVHLWNLSATYQFMESQRSQITLSVFDVLNENTAIRRTVSQNYILDVNTTVLQQYFLLTFSYNIKDFKSKSDKDMFRFW